MSAGFRTPESVDVMLVDDAPENLDILVEILRHLPYTVRPVTNAQTALNVARGKPPDLALIDVRLPGMDGLALCREFKRDENLKDVPVIFTSGLAGADDVKKAFQAGGADYIVKPYRCEEVLARVATQLEIRFLRNELGKYRKKYGNLE